MHGPLNVELPTDTQNSTALLEDPHAFARISSVTNSTTTKICTEHLLVMLTGENRNTW